MNDGKAPSHARAKESCDDQRIFYEPVERDRKKRIEWSRITTVYRGVVGAREGHGVWRFRC
jgi:hypothetical protein